MAEAHRWSISLDRAISAFEVELQRLYTEGRTSLVDYRFYLRGLVYGFYCILFLCVSIQLFSFFFFFSLQVSISFVFALVPEKRPLGPGLLVHLTHVLQVTFR